MPELEQGGGMVLDEAPETQTPQPEPEPVIEAADDDEPEGVVQVGDKRLVDVSIVAAERKRAREAAEKRIRETEITPLQAKAKEADELRELVNQLRPYADLVRQNPDILQRQQQPPQHQEPQISEDEAAQEARDLQLYDPQGQLDLKAARRVIQRRRQEVVYAAQQAAQAAIGPMQHTSAQQASRANFEKYAHGLLNEEGQLDADPQVVASLWSKLDPSLTAHPEVAELAMDAALGRSVRLRRGARRAAPTRESAVSEPIGRSNVGAIALSEFDRRAGLTTKDLAIAKQFKPGEVNSFD